ncbi:MAG: T9SS type A sorting domain-containing protein, partial [Cruoricaptor ignavus]|nr:T9SS type A sorting domain-containing protein [Cruoricaptor ignavus]
SNYNTREWTNNGITWTATDARTDETVNGRAIVIRNGKLTSSQISGGISTLTVTTERKFGGGSGTFTLLINGVEKGTIPYSASVTKTTIENINVEGNIVIELRNNSTSNRVALDDLSWTCHPQLSTNEIGVKNKISIKQNPVRNGEIHLQGQALDKVQYVHIYNVSGQLIQTLQKPFINNNILKINNLKKGFYILKLDSQVLKFIAE